MPGMSAASWKTFESRIDRSSECWNWLGKPDRSGYARFGSRRFSEVLAHRIAYRHLVGEIPAGLELDHTCRNKRCVNPSHLEPVTNIENIRRARLARTHCKRGHAFTPENTVPIRRGDWTGRRCRTCKHRVPDQGGDANEVATVRNEVGEQGAGNVSSAAGPSSNDEAAVGAAAREGEEPVCNSIFSQEPL